MRPPPARVGMAPRCPQPNYGQPLFMRPGARDYSKPNPAFPNLFNPYEPISIPPPSFVNARRLDDLVRDGKIYLSLSDAIVLGLENNYDIAIQRYNLDIADTDLLRARAGSNVLGVSSGLVTGTLGGSGASASLTSGGGPGGTSAGVGGAGAGAAGIVSSTNGSGPTPEALDPVVTANLELERASTPETSPFLSGGAAKLTQNTDQYNFDYNQGFVTGTALTVGYTNSRISSNDAFNVYSPVLQSALRAELTQHLLNGFRDRHQSPLYHRSHEQLHRITDFQLSPATSFHRQSD